MAGIAPLRSCSTGGQCEPLALIPRDVTWRTMTQWRVSPEGERQYLGQDGYWYVAPPPPYLPPSPPTGPVERKPTKMVVLIVGVVLAVLGTVVAVSVIVARRSIAGRYFTIPSGAMEPALQIGDTVHVESGSVNRGDIVVFSRPPNEHCGGGESRDLVKRVIGMPGDNVSLSEGYVYINGRRLDETWLPASEQGVTDPGPSGTSYSLDEPYRVPSNDYFVLGDNRTDSCDSRYWGSVQNSLIVGEVVAVSGP
jgi:signal peptidase I